MSSLIRWHPLREIQALRQQMDHLLESLSRNEPFTEFLPKAEGMTWSPAIELQETDNTLVLKAEVPGIPAKDLSVEVGEDSVVISGETREESKSEEKGFFRSELRYGKFYRRVPLPIAVKKEAVTAAFTDGMLTLTLPKVEETRRSVVKLDLAEQIRGAVTQERLQDEQRQETVVSRAAEALTEPDTSRIAEEAREAAVGDRVREEHLQETAHRRAADSIGAPV